MQMQHPGLSREAIVLQVQTMPEHKKRVVEGDKLKHKSAVAIAFEKAVEKSKS